jgi:uncharacterized protein with PIN domain
MIVVDSSALIAILEKESDAVNYAAAILQAQRLLISAVNVHETGMVLRARRGIVAANRMWRFLQVENDFEIVPFDETHARSTFGLRPLRQGHPSKGAAQSRRLRSLCAGQDNELPFAVQRR